MIKLQDLIRKVRSCETREKERQVIAKECALIRTAFKEEETYYRHANVAKLIYVSLLGYPTHFGQLPTLRLIASPRFSDKRVGYLGMCLLIEDVADVTTLVTNSVANDLQSDKPYVVGKVLIKLLTYRI